MGETVTAEQALADLRKIRAAPDHRFLPDDTSLADSGIDLAGLQGHRQLTDLHLVQLAARHGAVLATLDARLVAALAPADWVHAELVPL